MAKHLNAHVLIAEKCTFCEQKSIKPKNTQSGLVYFYEIYLLIFNGSLVSNG